MRIDMHTHCKPVSECAWLQPDELPEIFKKAGIDAIVLTNHYYPHHLERLSNDLKEQARIFVDTFKKCKAKGDEIGIKVFFSAELKLINLPKQPEFLLYGLSEEDFISSFPIYDKTLEEVFDFCNEKDILLVQAHPYSNIPVDMNYVHGVEVYNPHPLRNPYYKETLELAIVNNKIKTSGADFHAPGQQGDAGLIVPDEISNQFELRDYLKQNKITIFDRNGILYQD